MSADVKTAEFKPLELNERNVNTLYKRCLHDESNPFEECYHVQVLRPEICGRISEWIQLSKNKVSAYESTIRYLLGQIKAFHVATDTFALQEGFMRYDETIWTKEYDVLFKMYSLGIASVSISDFVLYKDIIGAVKSSKCVPTLSPKDPNYAAWWEEHKGEWE